MSGGVAAGWYPDPAAPETQRYWDGEQWVGSAVPVDAAVPATPPEAAAALSQPGPTTGASTEPEGARLPFPPAFPSPSDADEPGRGKDSSPWERPAPDATPPPRFGSPYGPPYGAADAGAEASIPEIGLLAPPLLRLLARVIDMVAVGLLAAVVNSYFFLQYYREVSPQVDAYIQAVLAGKPTPEMAPTAEATRLSLIMTLTTIALWFAYEVPGTANSGQTLGKRLIGIRAARIGGVPLTFWQSTRRWLVLGIPALLLQACALPLQLIDCLWCTWDRPLQQCLHDKGVQTVVVMAVPTPPPGTPTADGSPDDWRTR